MNKIDIKMDIEAIYNNLVNNSVFGGPDSDGVYALFARSKTCLSPFYPYIELDENNLVYIGESHSAKGRYKLHFEGTSSSSTLRRTLGAIFKHKWDLKALPRSFTNKRDSDDNYSKYCFEHSGEDKLSKWMQENLEFCAVSSRNIGIKKLESGLICKYIPPLNLKNNRKNPYKEKIEGLREICRDEAKGRWAHS